MKISFQSVSSSEEISQMILSSLKDTYENWYIEKSEEEINDSYEIQYSRKLDESKWISGFIIKPDEISLKDYEAFIEYFSNKLKENANCIALIKLYDETRFESYIRYYKDIANLEMQLREILSFIFYFEFSDDFYNLLEEFEINFPKDTPDPNELQKRLENQFFYLVFSDYLNLDKPKEIRKVKDINIVLENSDSFDEFKNKICNRGIKHEEHLDFLASIKKDLQTLEGVRNAIAHNRTISATKLGHYETAKEHLLEKLQEFWTDEE